MSIKKIPPVVKYHIYGKTFKRQIRFVLYTQEMDSVYFDDNVQKMVSNRFFYKPIIFNTLLEVFQKGDSYLQTKHLRTLIFYGLLSNHNNLPRITYYAFPDK